MLFILKLKIFLKPLLLTLKNGFDKSNHSKDDNRPLPIVWNEKGIGLFKDELSRKIMKEFVELRAKTWTYLIDDDTGHKKAKEQKSV